MNLIDKEKVIEEINFCIEHTHSVYTDAFVYLKTIIESLPVVNQWIPCSERLPEEKGVYLVTVESGRDKGIYIQFFDNEDNGICIQFYNKEWFSKAKITAWQPLPKPYKEKENVD